MPATLVTWPNTVPACFMPDSPSGGPKPNRYSFQSDSDAVPIERPRYSFATEVYDVELTPLSVAQFQDFQDWFRDDLAFGTKPFAHGHPVTGVVGAWKFVSADPAYRVQRGRMTSGNPRGIQVSFKMQSVPWSAPIP